MGEWEWREVRDEKYINARCFRSYGGAISRATESTRERQPIGAERTKRPPTTNSPRRPCWIPARAD